MAKQKKKWLAKFRWVTRGGKRLLFAYPPGPRRKGAGVIVREETIPRNPPARELYHRARVEVVGQKDPRRNPHHCDAACRRAKHWYRHAFRRNLRVYGLANGDILLRAGR